VTAASKEGYEQAPHLLRPGGTMVAVGLPKDPTVIAGASPLLLALKRVCHIPSVVLHEGG
jgi:propanol-preferring alcohol dehydrogenase